MCLVPLKTHDSKGSRLDFNRILTGFHGTWLRSGLELLDPLLGRTYLPGANQCAAKGAAAKGGHFLEPFCQNTFPYYRGFLLVIFSGVFGSLVFFDFCGCLELTILGGYYLNLGL